ncbi:MAG TPA: septation inhibitor protein [Hungateiclostridium thermocellum]|jgi:cell division protein DivIC|uniref:Septum formation initiator n=2 Tax=Acetivibrio thermocellus TaxID=1515 RepID=A3DIT1_ACET2|nr:septum formation initiator family protein [Acetivibrio thermocellus]CDG37125.1 septum formation initiator [Acetivibrio thermocellus BC1]ABN53860.1 Septum formation initiator [Acetivibrio thermocellus ATCC 27405]ADU73344.1 Septum formation initiator [Acetivibrio thermocellus DSM 1313]ALX07262.1 Septum formation initiator [Acetivibrio thermocellus AD2]ANV74998.1 Septum formation initiator [Acetivibrio thermocellus DSM 2360]
MNKRKKRSWGLIIITGALMMYLGTVLVKQQFIINSQRQQLKQIQENIEQEKELNEKLLRQKEEIASKEYSEKIARESLGMVKNGERVFVDVNQ